MLNCLEIVQLKKNHNNNILFYIRNIISDTLYDVPTGLIVLLSVLYGSISMLAVVGNFLVMWVVATSRRMQSVTNCYIANLALADIVIGLFAIPFQVCQLFFKYVYICFISGHIILYLI